MATGYTEILFSQKFWKAWLTENDLFELEMASDHSHWNGGFVIAAMAVCHL